VIEQAIQDLTSDGHWTSEEHHTPSKAPLSPAERAALGIGGAGMLGLGVYALETGAPSTLAYLISVAAVAFLIMRFRSTPIPGPLAIALAVDANLHLAGGLIRVGNDVLYNASLGPYVSSLNTHLFQYDHFVHAFGSFVGTLALWTLLVPPSSKTWHRRDMVVLCALAGLGIGAINETLEFLATLAHNGAHVGGYTNTGWDLTFNILGAVAASCLVARSHRTPQIST
jgi:hypothetical protein